MNVSVATAEEREAAFMLLASHHPPADRDRAARRYRDLISTGDLDPAGIFVSRGSTGTIRGAMVVTPMPGAMGLAWPPVAARREGRAEIEDALVAAACGWLKTRGVKVCQAFGGELDRESFAPLERAGFKFMSRILELRRELTDDPPPISRLSFHPFEEAIRGVFEATLLASFEESLDSPEVNGSRTNREFLDSYSDAPTGLWRLAKMEDEPAGVVLLNPSEDRATCELMYLGLVPKFRRLGLGSELVSFARTSARNSGRASLSLSVDERNLPARRLYETQGFQASGARSVFLADWPPIS